MAPLVVCVWGIPWSLPLRSGARRSEFLPAGCPIAWRARAPEWAPESRARPSMRTMEHCVVRFWAQPVRCARRRAMMKMRCATRSWAVRRRRRSLRPARVVFLLLLRARVMLVLLLLRWMPRVLLLRARVVLLLLLLRWMPQMLLLRWMPQMLRLRQQLCLWRPLVLRMWLGPITNQVLWRRRPQCRL